MPPLDVLLRSLSADRGAWLASTAITIAVYAALAIAVPIVLARLPADYFARPPRSHTPLTRAARVAVGLVITAAGVAMLFLPGPGIVTILLGLTLMGGDLAARSARRLVAEPHVFDAINAVRRRRGRPPLERPPVSK